MIELKAVGRWMKNGWSGALEFYQFKCKKHGMVVNYAEGHDEILRCPICWQEEITGKEFK